jgi:hypothetical protein
MKPCPACKDMEICDFCRFFIFKDMWCTKHEKETDPLDVCEDYECALLRGISRPDEL